MKKSEIATKIFEIAKDLPLVPLLGGSLPLSITDFAALALLPWWSDISVHWAVRISPAPGETLNKKSIPKVKTVMLLEDSGSVLAGIPGDGIDAPLWALMPLGEALSSCVKPGMQLELATANLGVVNRDYQVKAETKAVDGNQRYHGRVEADGRWSISQSSLTLPRADLEHALAIARMVVNKGPFTVKDRAEAAAVIELWIRSWEPNVNPQYVKQVVRLDGDRFKFLQPQDYRRFCGLGLGYFRHRFDKGPFKWKRELPPGYAAMCTPEVAKDVVNTCLG